MDASELEFIARFQLYSGNPLVSAKTIWYGFETMLGIDANVPVAVAEGSVKFDEAVALSGGSEAGSRVTSIEAVLEGRGGGTYVTVPAA